MNCDERYVRIDCLQQDAKSQQDIYYVFIHAYDVDKHTIKRKPISKTQQQQQQNGLLKAIVTQEQEQDY